MQFDDNFRALTDYSPFNWQRRLYDRMIKGDMPAVCDIPTGLGKTSAIPIWLVALAHQIHERGGKVEIPRRLIYIVDRRTVVDQATAVSARIRERLTTPSHFRWQVHEGALEWMSNELKRISATEEPVIAVSTLRGEFADNEEWKKDPTKPSIIIGTIDMIGSKLLFSGYGDGRYLRPQHAGLIGHDSLIIHDEAHLTPAFSELLQQLEKIQRKSGEPRPVKRMELSATARGGIDSTLTIVEKEDGKDQTVMERMGATKRLHLHLVTTTAGDKDRDIRRKIRDQITELSLGYINGRDKVVVYVRSPEDAAEIFRQLDRKVGSDRVELLTGTIRGYERDKLVEKPLFQKFLTSGSVVENTIYLVSTSAGEVGIDIDADHMVCDLTTLDSLIQRLGRVNRRGWQGKAARIDMVAHSVVAEDQGKLSETQEALNTTLSILSEWASNSSGEIDGSPRGLRASVDSLNPDQRKRAFMPRSAAPKLSDISLDLWSLTSIDINMPGRSQVASYLHGLEKEPPETYVVWRKEVKLLAAANTDRVALSEWFDACRILARERLHDRSKRVKEALVSLLEERRKQSKNQRLDFPLLLIDARGEVLLKEHSDNQWHLLSEIVSKDFNLDYLTIVLPVEVGGLGTSGVLDPKSPSASDVAEAMPGEVHSRQRRVMTENEGGRVYEQLLNVHGSEALADGLKETCRITLKEPEEDDIKVGRYLILFSESGQLAEKVRNRQSLDFHLSSITSDMERICCMLQLEKGLKESLVTAAKWHDRGKNRPIWQWYANNEYPAIPLAKSAQYKNGWDLGGYRHEFGSLLEAEGDDSIRTHSEADLILHLIAAHHGWARPHFERRARDSTYTTAENEAASAEAMQRFGRLQQRFGRWGLAWLESLLRCADIISSNKVEAKSNEMRRNEVCN